MDLQAIPHDGSHLTPDQARTIDAYLVEALNALNLGNWRVYVGKDLPPERLDGYRAGIEGAIEQMRAM